MRWKNLTFHLHLHTASCCTYKQNLLDLFLTHTHTHTHACTRTHTLHSPEVSWQSISRWHFVRGWVWHLCRVAMIGFVLCCRSDRGKIDREGLRVCVCVCVCKCVCVRVRAGACDMGMGRMVCVSGKGKAGKVRLWGEVHDIDSTKFHCH